MLLYMYSYYDAQYSGDHLLMVHAIGHWLYLSLGYLPSSASRPIVRCSFRNHCRQESCKVVSDPVLTFWPFGTVSEEHVTDFYIKDKLKDNLSHLLSTQLQELLCCSRAGSYPALLWVTENTSLSPITQSQTFLTLCQPVLFNSELISNLHHSHLHRFRGHIANRIAPPSLAQNGTLTLI